MRNKIYNTLLSKYLITNFVVLVVLTAILFFFNLWAGIIATVITAGIMIFNKWLSSRNAKLLYEYIENITSEMDETIAYSVLYNPLPLCMIKPAGDILWFNQKFMELFPNTKVTETHLQELIGYKPQELFSGNTSEGKVTLGGINKSYRILQTIIGDGEEKRAAMLHWLDVTDYENLKERHKDEQICYAFINVDNYDDLVINMPEEKKISVAAEIEKTIRQWAVRNQASIVRLTNSQYFIAFEFKNLEILEANKFSILDEIRQIETGCDFPASLSIGIGTGGKSHAQTEDYARASLDLALARGGDQCVVKKNTKVDFYGGKLQTVEKRNKGKSRIVAHALHQLVDQSSNVIIMGHMIPDMDSLGSAMGVSCIARNHGKESFIVINSWSAVDTVYEKVVANENYNFVTEEQAEEVVKKDSLLVVVDTHKPSLVEAPALFSKVDRVVVIDHHRRGEEFIANPTLTYIESYASSASELVTEILEYSSDRMDKRYISKLEAEILLAGITVDTKSFSVKTGVRTFEAASWLRRQGADTANVRALFQTDMNLFQLKASIIARAKTFPGGIAISYIDGPRKNISVLISMAADDILNIRGIKASFVVGEDEDGKTRISARSLGEINVQAIMEKLGGGGHLTTAGVQINIPVMDAVDVLEEVIDNFLNKPKAKPKDGTTGKQKDVKAPIGGVIKSKD